MLDSTMEDRKLQQLEATLDHLLQQQRSLSDQQDSYELQVKEAVRASLGDTVLLKASSDINAADDLSHTYEALEQQVRPRAATVCICTHDQVIFRRCTLSCMPRCRYTEKQLDYRRTGFWLANCNLIVRAVQLWRTGVSNTYTTALVQRLKLPRQTLAKNRSLCHFARR